MTKIPRNHLALPARQRKAGPMKHRNAPRGGARNEQADLLEEAEVEREYEGWVYSPFNGWYTCETCKDFNTMDPELPVPKRHYEVCTLRDAGAVICPADHENRIHALGGGMFVCFECFVKAVL